MTFREIYDNIEPVKVQSPKAAWISRIAEITKRSEHSVKMWLTGRQIPDALAQSIIAEELETPADELFPSNN
jgi:hypothetical protein